MQCGGMGKKAEKERRGKEGAASDNQTAATPKYIIDRGGAGRGGRGWRGRGGGAAALDAT
jgi:hypothetical protein